VDDLPEYAEIVTEYRASGPEYVTGEISESIRAWSAELGGQQFMTWEPKGIFDETPGFEPEYWFGFRFESVSPESG